MDFCVTDSEDAARAVQDDFIYVEELVLSRAMFVLFVNESFMDLVLEECSDEMAHSAFTRSSIEECLDKLQAGRLDGEAMKDELGRISSLYKKCVEDFEMCVGKFRGWSMKVI